MVALAIKLKTRQISAKVDCLSKFYKKVIGKQHFQYIQADYLFLLKDNKLRLTRSIEEPTRTNLSWEQLWQASDKGLIACWESGRAKGLEDTGLASAARNGELMILPWKGGVERALKTGKKYGTLNYLAMWQGLRGETLNICLVEDTSLTCSRTGMIVTYTSDSTKYDL